MKTPDAFPSGGPWIMGIVNVTPDSFSDGGLHADTARAVAHALRLEKEGAHVLDIGGESTRPGARPVTPAQEMDRVLPVIETLKAQGCAARLSIDTRNAATMRAAIRLGVDIVNDVSALRHDPDSLAAVSDAACHVCLMHMQGDPASMQDNPSYNNVVDDVFQFFLERIAICETAGIARARLIVDPGIGFGKTVRHNLDLLAGLDRFGALRLPVLLGASRKGFIGAVANADIATERLPGSLTAALHGLQRGVSIFRVHDVAATVQAFAVWNAIKACE